MGLAPDRRSHVRPCRTYQRDVGGPLISLNALAGHRSTSWRLCVTLRRVLVELTMTEQRYRAVLDVRAGVPVIEVPEPVRGVAAAGASVGWAGIGMRAWLGWPIRRIGRVLIRRRSAR